MKVFVTGAAGFVGRATVQELLSHGHTVVGLARSEETAATLEQLGAEVLRGDIKDDESLTQGASSSDAVIHLAYIHDFNDFETAAKVDRRVIETLAAAVRGTDKPLVITQGLLSLDVKEGEVADENFVHETEGFFALRGQSETLIKRLAQDGSIRGIAVRLSPFVHGEGDRGLVTYFIGLAKQKGFVTQVGAGDAQWSSVHRNDVAALFRLAVENGKAGAVYHAVAENLLVKDIFAVLSNKLGVPVKSMSFEEAMGEIGFLAGASARSRPSSAAKTEMELGWKPTQIGALEDLEANYF